MKKIISIKKKFEKKNIARSSETVKTDKYIPTYDIMGMKYVTH